MRPLSGASRPNRRWSGLVEPDCRAVIRVPRALPDQRSLFFGKRRPNRKWPDPLTLKHRPLFPAQASIREIHGTSAVRDHLELDAAIERVAGELLSAGPEATRAAKQLIRERPGGDEAARLAAKLRTSSEGQEGLRAFLDKRPAAWRSGSSS